MTLRHLRIFVAVCETGTMTAASDRLFIAQPSVSLAISEMEEYYGVRLFDRISRRLYLTESGRRVLQYARHIISLMDEMEQEVKNPDAVGRLRIGTSITIGSYLLPEYIKKLKEQYPSLQIEAVIGNSGNIEQKILDNEIDIGIIEGAVHSSYIESRTFEGDRMVFICPSDHKFAGRRLDQASELKAQDFLVREKGSASREMLDGILAANEIAVKPLWESTSNQAILHGVKQGLGISLLPWLLVREVLEKGEAAEFTVNGPELSRKFSVIYHKNKFLPRSAQALMQLCGLR